VASIKAVTSMSQRNQTTMRKAGVRTTDALLKMASSRTGRRRLARETGLDEADILAWANCADLMRVPGVGPEYAELLAAAGVDTIRSLRRRNPDRLLEAITDLNLRRRLVRRLPTDGMVADWVAGAKATEPVITH
jgi:predicted flap endonuclease-1-like 5' DNA nuclease